MAWKKIFLASHAATNCANKSNKKYGVSFGRANTDSTINRSPSNVATSTATNIMPQVETHMENIDAASTINHETLGALVDSTERLTTTNAQQHSTIESIWADIKELRAVNNTGRSVGKTEASGHRLSATQEKQAIQSLKRGWYIGGVCSTHEFGVTRRHTSAMCSQCCDRILENATHVNPVSPGNALNKGQDKYL